MHRTRPRMRSEDTGGISYERNILFKALFEFLCSCWETTYSGRLIEPYRKLYKIQGQFPEIADWKSSHNRRGVKTQFTKGHCALWNEESKHRNSNRSSTRMEAGVEENSTNNQAHPFLSLSHPSIKHLNAWLQSYPPLFCLVFFQFHNNDLPRS